MQKVLLHRPGEENKCEWSVGKEMPTLIQAFKVHSRSNNPFVTELKKKKMQSCALAGLEVNFSAY